ncbi:MAG: 50S ribosomal protein L22 [Dehalococcoidia bacterium]|nr:50S ribosomal protein L22 [Dehalococcoidia bacterium]
MEVRATAKYVGISPQKLDLLAATVRGKKVNDALAMLSLAPSPSARALAKVIKSAASNAENNYQMPMTDLKVVRLVINQGSTLKRIRAQARGRVSPILRHTSHITAIVDTEE